MKRTSASDKAGKSAAKSKRAKARKPAAMAKKAKKPVAVKAKSATKAKPVAARAKKPAVAAAKPIAAATARPTAQTATKAPTLLTTRVKLDHGALAAVLDEDALDALDDLPRTIEELVTPADPLDFADASDLEYDVLQALTKTHGKAPRTLDGPVRVAVLAVVDGSLHVRGDLVIDNHLFVLGDLRVDGAISVAPHSILAIAGVIHAGHFQSVHGNVHTHALEVDGLAHLRSDGYVLGAERVSAKVVWDDPSHYYVDNEFEPSTPTIATSLALRGAPTGDQQRELAQLFGGPVPGDPFELFDALKSGTVSFAR
jgi:hypothetical protein